MYRSMGYVSNVVLVVKHVRIRGIIVVPVWGGYYFYENVGSGSLRVFSNICYMFCPISLFKY